MNRLIAFLLWMALGFGTALMLAWTVLSPSEVVSEPANLKPETKEQYILLTAMSYAQDGDLERAKIRLALLQDLELRDRLTRLAERYINELKPEHQRRSLAKLAVAMGADSVTLRVYVVTPTPTPTLPPTATPSAAPSLTPQPSTIIPARTPTATSQPTATLPRVNYRLFEQVRLNCEQEKTPRARILIYVQDANGKGIPGVRVRVQWNDGQEAFFTGLKGGDPGYADFDMQAGKSYSVLVADGTSQVAFGLDADQLNPECPKDGKEHYRAWRVIFRRIN